MEKLKCPVCGGELHLSLGYDGCDWDSAAGEGSGYGYSLSLICRTETCRRAYELGRLRDSLEFSEPIESLRAYAGKMND